MHYNGPKADYERVIHLLREIEFAKSQLAPHDTGHISTAIGWMEKRVATLTRKLDETPASDANFTDDRPPWRMAVRREVQRNKNTSGIYPEDC